MTARASVNSDLGSRDIHNQPLKKLSKKGSCLKCQKGGNVLVCNDGDCPIVVHESCMSSGARFDDNGKFFCPYCFFKQSVSECRQAKEKALFAKEALSRFLDMNKDKNNGNLERSRSLKRKELDSPTNMQNRNDDSGSKVETSETVKKLGTYHNGSKGREQTRAELQENSVYLATKENTTDIHEESPKGSDSTSQDDYCVRSQIALTSENAEQPAEIGGQTPEKSSRSSTYTMKKDSVFVKHRVLGNLTRKHQETAKTVEGCDGGSVEKKHNQTMHQETSVCRTRKGATVDMHEECDKRKHSTFQVDYFVRSQRAVISESIDQSAGIGEGHFGRTGEEKSQIQQSIDPTSCMRKDNMSVTHEISEASKEGSHDTEKLEGYHDGVVETQQREACAQESSFFLTRKDNVEKIHEEYDQGNDSMVLDDYIIRNQMAANEENPDEPADIGHNHYGMTNEVQKQIKLPENDVHPMPDNVSVTLEESEAGDDTVSSQDSYDTGQGICSKWKGKMLETLKSAYQPGELSESSEIQLSKLEEYEEVIHHTSMQKVDGAKETQHPGLPSTRRRKLAWTIEEVEMLKEGVQKFSLMANKNLPWMKILEFGRHIFDGTRTPVDLKDKWRNLMGKGDST